MSPFEGVETNRKWMKVVRSPSLGVDPGDTGGRRHLGFDTDRAKYVWPYRRSQGGPRGPGPPQLKYHV